MVVAEGLEHAKRANADTVTTLIYPIHHSTCLITRRGASPPVGVVPAPFLLVGWSLSLALVLGCPALVTRRPSSENLRYLLKTLSLPIPFRANPQVSQRDFTASLGCETSRRLWLQTATQANGFDATLIFNTLRHVAVACCLWHYLGGREPPGGRPGTLLCPCGRITQSPSQSRRESPTSLVVRGMNHAPWPRSRITNRVPRLLEESLPLG